MTDEGMIRRFVESHMVALDDHPGLGEQDNFFERGFVDSLFATQLIAFLETRLGIVVTDEDLDVANFCSIARVAEFVGRKKSV